jgi:hypothetical protein
MVLGNDQISNTFIYGNIAVTGSIIPVVSNEYDIGSSGMPFRNGYFGTNSQSLLIIVPQSSVVPAVRGGIYFNLNDNKFYKCTNGVDWVDM